MSQAYLSLFGELSTQKVIEKSKFIVTSRHATGEEEARGFIFEVSRRYPDATHNCYAYIADNLGNFPRFSDDGEPQGTAGLPILDVLKNNKLYEVAVVVTRYFGGIKLGAGGLVRAYSGCTAENIASAVRVLYETCSEKVYITDYSNVDTALRFFSKRGANIISTEYLNEVCFTVAIKKSEEEEFDSSLVNALNGRVKIKKTREYFFPFRV